MPQCSPRKFDLYIYKELPILEKAERMPEPKYEWLIAQREVEWRNSKFCTGCSRSKNFPCKKAAATLLCGIPRWSSFLFAALMIEKKIKTFTKNIPHSRT
jgi:hypothetical protein